MNFKQFGRTANLFDENASDKSNNCYLRATGDFVNSQNFDTSGYVDINGQTTITLSGMGTGNEPAYCLYNASKERISGENYANRTSIAITVGNAKYIRFSYRKADVDTTMLNTGSTVLPYQPYKDWTDTPHYIHKTATDTLTLPAVIYPNDTSITVGIKGQSSQASTPSPSSPVSVDGCGEKTANLFDDHNIITIEDLGDRYGVILPEGTYSIYNGTDNIVYDGINDFQNRHVACEAHSTTTITLYTHPNTTCGFLMALNAASQGGVTIVSGSKPPSSYIPYGYKIPILNNSQTTNVYLGEVQTTRKIKKLVFTGAASETWVLRGGSPNSIFFIELSGIDYINNTMLCTHFINQDEGSFDDLENNHALIKVNADLSGSKIAIRDTDFTTTNEFKTWLSQQYVNGTPVTVWYALATPETAVVNEPLRKIGTYADEVSGITIPTIAGENAVDVLTTLKPSEVTATYKGWHPVADVHERESGAWT